MLALLPIGRYKDCSGDVIVEAELESIKLESTEDSVQSLISSSESVGYNNILLRVEEGNSGNPKVLVLVSDADKATVSKLAIEITAGFPNSRKTSTIDAKQQVWTPRFSISC